MPTVGSQPGGLVHAQGGDVSQPSRVIDQRLADGADRRHDRVPAGPVGAGDLCDAVAVAAHPHAGVAAGPLGQQRPRRDPAMLLAPGRHRTCRLRAAPTALAPAQPHRPPERVHITHHRRQPALKTRPHATASTPLARRGRLDRQLQLTLHLDRAQHAHVLQSEHADVGCPTLLLHLSPPHSLAVNSCEFRRASGCFRGRHPAAGPHFIAMSPISAAPGSA